MSMANMSVLTILDLHILRLSHYLRHKPQECNSTTTDLQSDHKKLSLAFDKQKLEPWELIIHSKKPHT